MRCRDQDVETFPPGTLVRTPTGRIGIVKKSRGHESRFDHFQRIVVDFGGGPRDNVVLQPHLLERFEFIKRKSKVIHEQEFSDLALAV